KVKDWDGISQSINPTSHKVAILNHGRDIHNGFRPFDEGRHIAIAGLNLDRWRLPANGMEVVNSGALLNDRMRLFLDWFGMLNRGISLTPVGASDSHDVGRYLVGQARTYIRATDNHPGNININEAISNFTKGNVMVSFGLLPEIKVNKEFGPGDLVSPRNEINIEVKVSGPSWINADSVTLFANGIKIHASAIKNKSAAGVKWKGNWNLRKQRQDIFLVAIAEGRQRNLPFWPIVKPYQPTNTSWSPYAIGCTGAVWIDADSDGKFTSAYEYASRLVVQFSNRMDSLIIKLNIYDETVAIQAAAILYESGIDLRHPNFQAALKMASNSTAGGINKFIEGLKLSGR
ncbi:MAG TPA: hypothetical protein VEV87_09185, partial [Chitinophagaceae bacterium]|nr:hypothetical protein [Chitinophagaceae bacterium]